MESSRQVLDVFMINENYLPDHCEVELMYDDLTSQKAIVSTDNLYHLTRQFGAKYFVPKLSRHHDWTLDIYSDSEEEYSYDDSEEYY